MQALFFVSFFLLRDAPMLQRFAFAFGEDHGETGLMRVVRFAAEIAVRAVGAGGRDCMQAPHIVLIRR